MKPQTKYICPKCESIHHYLPAEGCRRCSFKHLEKMVIKPFQPKVEDKE